MKPYLDDEMAESAEHKEQLHREALAKYNAWQADRTRRLAAYDKAVDAYHAELEKACAARDARDRAEYAAYLDRCRLREAAE